MISVFKIYVLAKIVWWGCMDLVVPLGEILGFERPCASADFFGFFEFQEREEILRI